ncbi:MAG: helicase-associated domain-containing protein [Verrucomicrobiales bacterium]|nr:helicase-associated domain-containing protein [Verrucomicrobiales bacterium]
MKCLDTDWESVLHWLGVWSQLTVPSRRHFLNLSSANLVGVPEEGYGTDLPRVLESGLATRLTTGAIRPAPDAQRFWRLVRHLAEFPLFDQKPTARGLEEYLQKYYASEELFTIRGGWTETGWDSEEWTQAFLRAKQPRRWEADRLTSQERQGHDHRIWRWDRAHLPAQPKTWFPDPETFTAAKALVRAAVDSGSPLPLSALPGLLPADLRPRTAGALKACLRYLLLYAALRKDSLDVVVGLCPVALYQRNRPPAVPPVPRPADGLLRPASLMEDMTRLLAMAAAGECRLKQSSHYADLYQRDADRLLEQLVALPPWIECRHAAPKRLQQALETVLECGFASQSSKGKEGRFLLPTAVGRQWLARSPAGRLHELLREFRKDDGQGDDRDSRARLLSRKLTLRTRMGDDFDARPWLDSIWREAAGEAAFCLDEFLEHHARVSHPLISPAIPEEDRPGQCFRYDRDDCRLRTQNVEEITRELLALFFWERLVPLGCVETLADEADHTLFRLSSAGRCFVGMAPELEYGQPVQDARIVVQPNFEIVFLNPNLAAEIDFTPFAERCGHGVGTLFRLTRPQTWRAAEEGMTVETVLAMLVRHVSSPVPANVEAELRAWFASCRTLVTRRAILLEAGDEETALRVQKLLGPESALLGKALVEWRGAKLDPKLRRKLAGQGIFIRG